MYMDIPASLYHGPVSLITVHGDIHTAAARGDASVKGVIIEPGQYVFQGFDIFRCAGGRNVTAVQQDMDTGFLHAFRLCFLQHGEKVADI